MYHQDLDNITVLLVIYPLNDLAVRRYDSSLEKTCSLLIKTEVKKGPVNYIRVTSESSQLSVAQEIQISEESILTGPRIDVSVSQRA